MWLDISRTVHHELIIY